jgi:hypothetical protein
MHQQCVHVTCWATVELQVPLLYLVNLVYFVCCMLHRRIKHSSATLQKEHSEPCKTIVTLQDLLPQQRSPQMLHRVRGLTSTEASRQSTTAASSSAGLCLPLANCRPVFSGYLA